MLVMNGGMEDKRAGTMDLRSMQINAVSTNCFHRQWEDSENRICRLWQYMPEEDVWGVVFNDLTAHDLEIRQVYDVDFGFSMDILATDRC